MPFLSSLSTACYCSLKPGFSHSSALQDTHTHFLKSKQLTDSNKSGSSALLSLTLKASLYHKMLFSRSFQNLLTCQAAVWAKQSLWLFCLLLECCPFFCHFVFETYKHRTTLHSKKQPVGTLSLLHWPFSSQASKTRKTVILTAQNIQPYSNTLSSPISSLFIVN